MFDSLNKFYNKIISFFKPKPYDPYTNLPSLMSRLVWYAGGSLKRVNDAILMTRANPDGKIPLAPLLDKIDELLEQDGKYHVLYRNKKFRADVEKNAEKRLT